MNQPRERQIDLIPGPREDPAPESPKSDHRKDNPDRDAGTRTGAGAGTGRSMPTPRSTNTNDRREGGGRERNHGNERTRVWRPYRQLVGAGDAGLGVHQIERRREASGPESARGPAASRHEPRGTGEAEEGPRL